MRKAICVLAVGLALTLGSTAAVAVSVPSIEGRVSGIELCPQFICGAAVFAGGFQGQVGINPHATGIIVAAFTHEDLPEPGEFSAITGGVWELRTVARRFQGIVLGGTLFNNGDNTFRVRARLLLTSGGGGIVTFDGFLNHNTLIPTFGGTLGQ